MIIIRWSGHYEKTFDGLLEAMEFVIRREIIKFEIKTDNEWEDGQTMLDGLRRLLG